MEKYNKHHMAVVIAQEGKCTDYSKSLKGGGGSPHQTAERKQEI